MGTRCLCNQSFYDLMKFSQNSNIMYKIQNIDFTRCKISSRNFEHMINVIIFDYFSNIFIRVLICIKHQCKNVCKPTTNYIFCQNQWMQKPTFLIISIISKRGILPSLSYGILTLSNEGSEFPFLFCFGLSKRKFSFKAISLMRFWII